MDIYILERNDWLNEFTQTVSRQFYLEMCYNMFEFVAGKALNGPTDTHSCCNSENPLDAIWTQQRSRLCCWFNLIHVPMFMHVHLYHSVGVYIWGGVFDLIKYI